MPNTDNIQWKRISAEGAAIVVSILLAFSIQAWWDERREHIAETAILEAVVLELRELNERIEENDRHVSAIRQSARKLLEASTQSNPDLSDMEIDRLLADITWFVDSTFLDLPVLQAAISGGDLATISNSLIRRQLGAWLVKINTVKASIKNDLDYYERRQMPFLDEHASILQISNATARRPGSPEQEYPGVWPAHSSTISHRNLLKNREFQNILMGRITTLTNIVEWRDPEIPSQLKSIIELIEDELEEE